MIVSILFGVSQLTFLIDFPDVILPLVLLEMEPPIFWFVMFAILLPLLIIATGVRGLFRDWWSLVLLLGIYLVYLAMCTLGLIYIVWQSFSRTPLHLGSFEIILFLNCLFFTGLALWTADEIKKSRK